MKNCSRTTAILAGLIVGGLAPFFGSFPYLMVPALIPFYLGVIGSDYISTQRFETHNVRRGAELEAWGRVGYWLLAAVPAYFLINIISTTMRASTGE